MNYILDGHTPVGVDDVVEWAREIEAGRQSGNWRVAEDTINGFRVSTVFLGLDHSFTRSGPPILFETMVFPNNSWADLACERYATWDEAEAGHAAMVERVKAGEFDEVVET